MALGRHSGFRRGNKYHAQGVRKGGHWYDSKAEAEYADVLELCKRGGLILDYQHHPPGVVLVGTIRWNIDYLVTGLGGQQFYVEVKGLATSDYKLKLELYRQVKPAPLYVVKRYGELRFRVIDEVATEDGCNVLEAPLAPA